jgi:RNA polymerase sigma factor (sigma-70 family)
MTEKGLDAADFLYTDSGLLHQGAWVLEHRRATSPRATAMDRPEPSDHELVRRVCQHDRQAFEMLYQRFHTPIRRFVLRLNRRLDNAEEIINDVMMVVWQKAETFNSTSKVSTWILGITYNKVLNASSQRSGVSEVDLDEVEAFLPGSVDLGMREYELQEWLVVAMDRLSTEQRAVMELTCLHGMSYEEIAEVLGCPENTVKTRMFHARKKLRQLLPELGAAEYAASDQQF